MNPNVEEAKLMAFGAIQSLEDFIVNLEKGRYSGRLYSKLIEAHPINSALQSINEYQKIAEKFNTPVEKLVNESMKKAENKLINTLITLAKNNDEEAITVIQQIIKTQDYGLQAFERMQELKSAINLQEEFSIIQITIPGEIFIKIFSECGVKELGRLMFSSKLFYKLANSDQTWKHICLKEDPTNFNNKNLTWKQLYIDEIDLKQYENGKIIFVNQPEVRHNTAIKFNLELKTITGKNLKQVIKKSLKLNCKLDDMRLFATIDIEDTDDSDKLKNLFDKTQYRVHLLKKVTAKSTQILKTEPEIKSLVDKVVTAENTQPLKIEPEIKNLVEKNQIHELEILEIAEEEAEEGTTNNSYCLLM